MKKVLFAISTLNGGGAERVVSVWSGQLAEMGYDVSIVVFGHTKDEYKTDKRVELYAVQDTYEEYTQLNYMSKIVKMRRIVKEIHPDLTINFLPRVQVMMLIATFGLGIRHIETVRVSPWELTDDNKLAELAWRGCFKSASDIIIQTDEQREFFGEKERKKCVVIPNPLSDSFIGVKKEKYSDKITRFVAAGRIDRQKNYVMMIKAFAKAKVKAKTETGVDLSLDIFGSGNLEYENMLTQLIKELKLEGSVRLMGRSNQLEKELVKYEAFLMSSDYEGMPNSLAEAMAVGLVCISTDCRTGPKDMIEDGVNGFLSKTGDVDLFAEAITKVTHKTRQEVECIGKNANDSIRSLTSKDASLRKLIETIEMS